MNADTRARRARANGVRRSPPLRFLGAAALVATLLAAPDCGRVSTSRAAVDPVFVLAVDGFEWDAALPLLRTGEMPHLAALMQRGTWGTLATLQPTVSPRLWATIATGKLPDAHGILGFVTPGPDGANAAVTSADRLTKAYWNILSERGITNDTIGWWTTYPVERVDGWMVAQTPTRGRERAGVKKHGLAAGVSGQVWPPEEEAAVLETLDRNHADLDRIKAEIFSSVPAELPPHTRRRWAACDWAVRADSTYVAVLRSRWARRPPSTVTALYLGGTDVVAHRFAAAWAPDEFGLDARSSEVVAFGRVIPDYYRYVDRVLGEAVASLPATTRVFVIADHGFSVLVPPEGEVDLNAPTGGHDGEPGIFVAAGPGIRDRGMDVPIESLAREHVESLGGIADFCPTLLALLGVPYGEDMAGRPLATVLEPPGDGAPWKSIATHDDAQWLAMRAERAPATSVVEDPERLEQLRELGYLDDSER